MLSDPLLVIATLAKLLDSFDIRYLVGGSLASSVYGIPRATQDVDVITEVATMTEYYLLAEKLRAGYIRTTAHALHFFGI